LANPAQIVICSGFAQGLAVLVKMLHDGGATEMAIEDPCAVHHRAIVRSNGLRIRPLAVDDGGAVSEPPKSAHAVLVTPAHQFPLGSTLEPKRRTALVRWAKDHEALVIEDDYDGEFRYDRQPVGALQGLDPDTVVYAGTASKTLVPGLRLGWLVLPQHLVAAAVNAKEVVGGEAGTLEQLTLAEFLRSGAYDRHVRRMRQRYRRRRDALLTTLNSSAPQLVPRGIAAGLHIVVEIPRGAGNERHLVQRAARRSLHIHALGPFWHDPPNAPQALVLGYGAPPEHAYAQTLDALAATLR
jgi:GntR family transcriptional regulator/MocR family aminotransferase